MNYPKETIKVGHCTDFSSDVWLPSRKSFYQAGVGEECSQHYLLILMIVIYHWNSIFLNVKLMGNRWGKGREPGLFWNDNQENHSILHWARNFARSCIMMEIPGK